MGRAAETGVHLSHSCGRPNCVNPDHIVPSHGGSVAGRRGTPEERFWERVNKIEGGCWEWTGSLGSHGYGQIYATPRKQSLTHRFSYELHVGPIPDGLFICHHCDNRKCVNPAHLFAGTNSDNIKDAVRRGRVRVPRGRRYQSGPSNQA